MRQLGLVSATTHPETYQILPRRWMYLPANMALTGATIQFHALSGMHIVYNVNRDPKFVYEVASSGLNALPSEESSGK
jgi:hypothetical protein